MAKITSIIAVVTLLALGFWVTAQPWIESPTKFGDWHIWIWPLALLIVFSGATAVAYMILPRKRLKLLLALLIGLAYLGVYARTLSTVYLLLIAFFLILVFHVFAIRAIQLESQERLKIHPWMIMHRGIAEIMLPIYIALSFAYFTNPAIQLAAQKPIVPVTFKEAASAVVDKFLPEETPEEAKSFAISRAYDAMTGFADPYRKYFPPIFAFGLFVVLWSLGFILYRLAMLVGIILFYLLRASKVVIVAEKMVPSETIALHHEEPIRNPGSEQISNG